LGGYEVRCYGLWGGSHTRRALEPYQTERGREKSLKKKTCSKNSLNKVQKKGRKSAKEHLPRPLGPALRKTCWGMKKKENPEEKGKLRCTGKKKNAEKQK